MLGASRISLLHLTFSIPMMSGYTITPFLQMRKMEPNLPNVLKITALDFIHGDLVTWL